MQNRMVTRDEWLTERKELLALEKELTRRRDELNAKRQALPWVRVDKDYVFDGPNGPESLADLFEGRSQLVIYHFMFGMDWEQGCPSCSYVSDHWDPTLIHLAHRDVTLRVVSRAPIERIEAFRERMGWKFHWVSSRNNDFNADLHVSFDLDGPGDTLTYNYQEFPKPADPANLVEEAHGLSVFTRGEDGAIYHAYSTYARGADMLIGTYHILDLVPKGRDEGGLAYPMAWMRHHDRYDDYEFDPKMTYPMPVRDGCCHGVNGV